MIINRFNRFLHAEVKEPTEYAPGESLADRMAGQEFVFNPPGSPAESTDLAPPEKPEAVIQSSKPEEKPEEKTEEAVEEEMDELPVFGAKKATEAKPANLDFDAQTDAIVAAITAKGHPGDEYKRLRAELKTLKEKKPIEDINAIPEVQTLRQQAAEAERLRGEAEALRQRNQELLRINNEVEVKESEAFIAQVKKPIDDIEKMVKQIATTANISPTDLFNVIAEADIIAQDRMLEQLHQKLGSRTAGRIERFCDDYKAATERGQSMLAESGQNAEKARLAREMAVRQQAEQKVELFKSSVESSFTQYAKSIPGYTDSSGNLTDIAKAAMHSASVVDINTLGPDDIGYLAFTASALPEARKTIVELRKEIALLKGTRKTAAPISGQPAPPPEKDDEYMGLAERMKGMEFTFTPPS